MLLDCMFSPCAFGAPALIFYFFFNVVREREWKKKRNSVWYKATGLKLIETPYTVPWQRVVYLFVGRMCSVPILQCGSEQIVRAWVPARGRACAFVCTVSGRGE